jgi:hypothetical protein
MPPKRSKVPKNDDVAKEILFSDLQECPKNPKKGSKCVSADAKNPLNITLLKVVDIADYDIKTEESLRSRLDILSIFKKLKKPKIMKDMESLRSEFYELFMRQMNENNANLGEGPAKLRKKLDQYLHPIYFIDSLLYPIVIMFAAVQSLAQELKKEEVVALLEHIADSFQQNSSIMVKKEKKQYLPMILALSSILIHSLHDIQIVDISTRPKRDLYVSFAFAGIENAKGSSRIINDPQNDVVSAPACKTLKEEICKTLTNACVWREGGRNYCTEKISRFEQKKDITAIAEEPTMQFFQLMQKDLKQLEEERNELQKKCQNESRSSILASCASLLPITLSIGSALLAAGIVGTSGPVRKYAPFLTRSILNLSDYSSMAIAGTAVTDLYRFFSEKFKKENKPILQKDYEEAFEPDINFLKIKQGDNKLPENAFSDRDRAAKFIKD